MGWAKYVRCSGLSIGMDHFGESAPCNVLAEKYGFTPAAVAAKVIEHFA